MPEYMLYIADTATLPPDGSQIFVTGSREPTATISPRSVSATEIDTVGGTAAPLDERFCGSEYPNVATL